MVRFSRDRSTVALVVGGLLLVVSGTIFGNHYLGHGRAGRTLSSASLPSGLRLPAASPSASTSAPPTPARDREPVAVKPGVPVRVVVSDHHLQAAISANHLNSDGSLYVPQDARVVSWSSQDVSPGAPYGTIILVAHINMGGVAGAFADLADYRSGQIITLVLADGRKLRYAVVAEPIEVNKSKVGPRRQELFDQTHSYGLPGRPASSRLLLLSCGGVFDNATGHYESNIFVYALPI